MGKTPADDVGTQSAASIEREVDELRERTEALLEELDQRIHENVDRAKETLMRVKQATNLPAQLRAHPRAAVGVGAGATIALALGAWLYARRESRRTLTARMLRRLHARRREPLPAQLVRAAAIAGVATLVRGVVSRAIAPASR
jgi:ElaB/YqjD/DUF883 family membrane-anchored ribosome-binding protein